MKIRRGFVSNSSSSSFVVIFNKIPKTAKELKIILFGDKREFGQYSVRAVSEAIFREMESPIDAVTAVQIYDDSIYGDSIYEEAKSLPFDADTEAKELAIWHEGQRRQAMKMASDEAKAFLVKVPEGGAIYTFEFSDEDGDFWGTIEHGGVFEKLEHKQISHH